MTETGELSRRQRSKTRSALSRKAARLAIPVRIRAASHPAGNSLRSLISARINTDGENRPSRLTQSESEHQ